MKYKVFDTQEQAAEEEKKISQQLGFAKPGINAKTGAVEEGKGITVRWAVPEQISDGRWVFPSPDDEGVEAEPTWWIVEEYI